MSNGATTITIVGNLTGDPELRYTVKGIPVGNFTVAVNRKTFNQSTAKWEDSGTDFYRVTAWRSMAENVAESLRKGDRVIVQGALESSEYENSEGVKRVVWEITAYAAGPDLLFATAGIKKAEFKKNDNNNARPRS